MKRGSSFEEPFFTFKALLPKAVEILFCYKNILHYFNSVL